jgi:hypothetical protein
MSERLAFLTDVLAATEGAEQRRSLRPTPRRSYEAEFLLTHNERSFWDLFIDGIGGGEMVAPLYWEVVSLTAPLTATVSNRIDFDTTRREWAYHTGRLAILMGETALDYEVVEIAAVDGTGVDLAAPPAHSWPVNTKLYPLRRAVLDDVGDVRQPSAAVGVVSARLRVVGPNPWVPAEDTSPVYAGLPVFLSEPNWVRDLDVTQDREIDLLDVDVGLTYQVDATGRVLLGQSHSWFLPGKEKLAEFRDLIYRHKGRAGAFWLPTFKADLRLAAPASSAATQITVENVGYAYSGGPRNGREYIAIKHESGTILRRVLSVIPGLTSDTERLNLDAPLGLDLSPGQVRRISFADTARFNSDEFEIVHYGGIDSHHDAQAMFRTFKNTRTAPLPIHFPQAPGVADTEPCGDYLGPPFPGWYLKIRYVIFNNEGLKMTDFTNVEPNTPLDYSFSIVIDGKVGSFGNGGLRTSPDDRPAGHDMSHDGVPWLYGDPIPSSAIQALREITYYSVESPVEADLIATFEDPRRDIQINWGAQHGAGTIKANTRGYHEFRFWDMPTWARVGAGDYLDGDGYEIFSNGNFVVPALWPVNRIFILRRPPPLVFEG